MAWARSDTVNSVSSVTRPSRRASNSMFSVISLDMEAGGKPVSASFSNRTVLWVLVNDKREFCLCFKGLGGGGGCGL